MLYGLGLYRMAAWGVGLGDYNSVTGEGLVRRGRDHKQQLISTNIAIAEALNEWVAIRGSWPDSLVPVPYRPPSM